MLNGITLPVRAHCVERFDSSPYCQRSATICGRQFGQVVTLSPFSRSDHRLCVGVGHPSLLCQDPMAQDTRLGRPLPGQDFHLLEQQTFHGAHRPQHRNCKVLTMRFPYPFAASSAATLSKYATDWAISGKLFFQLYSYSTKKGTLIP